MSDNSDRIEFNTDLGKWLLTIDGQPVACATKLDIMTRHFPTAAVVHPTNDAA